MVVNETSKESATYHKWMNELNTEALDRGVGPFDPENSAWRGCYDDGDTVAEALEAHLEAAESLT